MNIVLNNIHIGPLINSLASSNGLYGNFGLSSERYIIDLLIKLAKYLMVSSAEADLGLLQHSRWSAL